MNADRNLLFGILAFQNNFIDRQALLAAFDRWTADKNKSLGKILFEQGAITADDHVLLNALLRRHIEMHGDNAKKSLAALTPIGSIRDVLKRLADPEIQASLAHLSIKAADEDASTTLGWSATVTGPHVSTDLKTEQSLVVPSAVPPIGRIGTRCAWWKNWQASVGKRTWVLTACAVGATLLLLAGIVLFLETKNGTVRIEINDPAIEVVVDGKQLSVKEAKPDEIVLEPGQHGLRIKHGELEFETNGFILNRGDTITIKVELLAGKVEVVQDGTVLGQRFLPATSNRMGVHSKTPSDNVLGERELSTFAPSLAIAPFDAKLAKAHQEAWAKHLNTKVEIENSLGMRLCLIPPGEFMMGSPQAEKGHRNNERQHRVRITKAFYMGVHEVTQKEYQDLAIKNPGYFSPGGAGKDQVRGLDTNQFPVESVSWIDAVEFCRRLSASPAEQSAGRFYRVPTEAEWEYACRAGTTTPFHFGSQCNGEEANCNGNGSYGTNAAGPRLGRPTTVGSYTPNAFGLYDMHGNVWELCSDWYGEYGKSVDGVADPVGPDIGSYRVERGGGWLGGAEHCRSAFRLTDQPPHRFYNPYYLGFRIAAIPFSQASEAESGSREAE